MKNIPIFDGHNDVLLRLYRRGGADAAHSFMNGEIIDGKPAGQLDYPRSMEAGFAGGFFAIFVPSAEYGNPDDLMRLPSYDIPLPPQSEFAFAQAATISMASHLFRIEAQSGGRLKVCRTASELRHSIKHNIMAAVLHIEGAEAIDPDMRMLEVLHQAGLRSLGPVWSRNNIFGHGVPFRFPSSPDIGPGLTDVGKELVKSCNQLKIMIDLSHLNEKGFWDVAAISNAPLVATHSNAHALSTHSRNLTDRQLAAIRETKGMVGVNFAVSFLRADGRKIVDTPLETMLHHMDYLIEHLGEDHVGLGSDFDGATIPAEIGTVSGLPKLVEAMRAHGYSGALLNKICHENWVNLLERTWG